MKKIWIITLFPEYFAPLAQAGVVGQAFSGERASVDGQVHQLNLINLRDFSFNNYKQVDDYPFGGGAGMVMKPDVLARAIHEGVIEPGGYGESWKEKLHIVYPGPRGEVWSSSGAKRLASEYLGFDCPKDLVFICGRYEGIDERFIDHYVDQHISLGNFILSGGELAVMVILDSAMRYVDGVLGNKLSASDESYEEGLLEYPQYTRPREFEGQEPPEVLLSGHHANIEKWKKEQRLDMTKRFRPDLLNE